MTPGLRTVDDILLAFGPFYNDVRELGYGFLFVFLTLALIFELLQGMQEKSNYRGLFVRTLLIGGGFMIYTPLFREIAHGMELLANFYMPSEDLKQAMDKIFTAYKQNHDLGGFAILKMTFMEWMTHFTYGLTYWVMRIFNWARIVFLAALYLTGPIFLGIGIFLPRMILNWMRWLFEILTWNVVLALFVRILVEMNLFEIYTKADTPTPDIVAMNLFMIVLIVFFVFRFSAMMIHGKGGGFSGMGGAVFAVGTAMALRQATQGARGLTDRLGKVAGGFRDRFRKTPAGGTNPSYKGTP